MSFERFLAETLEAHAAATTAHAGLALRVSTLIAEAGATKGALDVAEGALTRALGALELGEASADDVAAARAARDALAERLRGQIAACDTLVARLGEAKRSLDGLTERATEDVIPLADDLARVSAERCRELAADLARELKRWAAFDASANRGVFAEGARVEQRTGVLGVLRAAGLHAELQVYSKPSDLLSPAEILAAHRDLPAEYRAEADDAPSGGAAA